VSAPSTEIISNYTFNGDVVRADLDVGSSKSPPSTRSVSPCSHADDTGVISGALVNSRCRRTPIQIVHI
jgi:hypothetical protein